MLRWALWIGVLFVSMGARQKSSNFIVETSDPQLCRQLSEAAEKYRRELAVLWLGGAMPDWSAPCVMTVQAAANLGAGGATTFWFDKGEVYGWRMTIQGSPERLLDSVLPHEITHMVFASYFRCPLPRWADEGGATSVEHSSEKAKHQHMLMQFLQTGRGIAFSQMFGMTEYPHDVMPLYAQGYSLSEYLIETGGRRKFVEFLAEGVKSNNWPAAVQRHYGLADLGALQNTWLSWVTQGSPRLTPPETQVAAAPRPRPAPNLILRIGNGGPLAPVVGRTLAGAPGVPQGVSAAWPQQAASVSLPPSQSVATAGWHVAGVRPPVPAAPPNSDVPIRAELSHPQPVYGQ
jgi:hypothetical protein